MHGSPDSVNVNFMGTGDNTKHSRPTAKFDAEELIRLTRGDIVTVPLEEVGGEDPNDAFSDWDEDSRFPEGSQPEAMPATSRTATLADPLTTGLLAEASRRSHTLDLRHNTPAPAPSARTNALPGSLPDSLEEALRAFTRDDAPAPATPPVFARARRASR